MNTSVLGTRADIERRIAGHTMCSAFLDLLAEPPPTPAFRWRTGEGWEELTWAGYAERASRFAGGLAELGFRRGERLAILCRNRIEFHIADLGGQLAGGTPLSLYNSSAPEQIKYVLAHSEATTLVVEDEAFLERVVKVRAGLPYLRSIIVVDPAGVSDPAVLPAESILAAAPVDPAEAAARVQPTDMATVIYTSGTTGPPKGVMLTQRNVRFGAEVFTMAAQGSMRSRRTISYLPMAHIAERMITHYFHLLHGTVVHPCPDLSALGAHMAEVKPQWWFCAPRMWEKLHAGIGATLATEPDRAAAFRSALEIGWAYFVARNAGRQVPAELAGSWASARHAVVGPVLARLGLDQVEVALSGAAPMRPELSRFFLSCGIPVSDCYGQSETTGAISWDPNHIVPGTSGRPFPGVEVRLATDGEVEVRGPNVFAGYLKDPERTSEALTADGWLRTGDIGEFDPVGNLRVVDRKKEILVPTSGHKVSPVQLEAAVKDESPLIGQACAVGDGRPFVSLIAALDPDMARAWARQRGIEADLAELARQPELLAEVAAAVDRANARFAPAEQIRSYTVVGEEWLPDSELLTSTAKLKRRGVHARYHDEIERLYAG